jgi:RimJ/RimL family protein N-acetyltransferase
MPTGRSSAEREFASLTGELHALEQDIAGARAASAKAHARMDVFESPKPTAPLVEGDRVRLEDGSEVTIRPIEPHDAPLLEIGLEHLSAMSRYRRFRSQVESVDRDELEQLTRVDHRRREAVAAFDPKSGEGVGIARYVIDPRDAEQAEVTYVVTDAWQRRGVGSALLGRLAERARAVGIERVTATMLEGNVGAHRTLADIAEPIDEHREGGLLEITAKLRS